MGGLKQGTLPLDLIRWQKEFSAISFCSFYGNFAAFTGVPLRSGIAPFLEAIFVFLNEKTTKVVIILKYRSSVWMTPSSGEDAYERSSSSTS